MYTWVRMFEGSCGYESGPTGRQGSCPPSSVKAQQLNIVRFISLVTGGGTILGKFLPPQNSKQSGRVRVNTLKVY